MDCQLGLKIDFSSILQYTGRSGPHIDLNYRRNLSSYALSKLRRISIYAAGKLPRKGHKGLSKRVILRHCNHPISLKLQALQTSKSGVQGLWHPSKWIEMPSCNCHEVSLSAKQCHNIMWLSCGYLQPSSRHMTVDRADFAQ